MSKVDVTKLVQEIAAEEGPCVAFCDEPPWYFHSHPCPNRSTLTIAGLRVCGTHGRVLRKWMANAKKWKVDETPEQWAQDMARERWRQR